MGIAHHTIKVYLSATWQLRTPKPWKREHGKAVSGPVATKLVRLPKTPAILIHIKEACKREGVDYDGGNLILWAAMLLQLLSFGWNMFTTTGTVWHECPPCICRYITWQLVKPPAALHPPETIQDGSYYSTTEKTSTGQRQRWYDYCGDARGILPMAKPYYHTHARLFIVITGDVHD